MRKVLIILKSGNEVNFVCKDLTLYVSDEDPTLITGYEVDTTDTKLKLIWFDPKDIAVVITQEEF